MLRGGGAGLLSSGTGAQQAPTAAGAGAVACARRRAGAAKPQLHVVRFKQGEALDARSQKSGKSASSSATAVVPELRRSVPHVSAPPPGEGLWPRAQVIAFVLGGGESDRRMWPLTEKRALPAVPVGGNYRLVDIPISNLLNSGMNKVYVLTQFNSQSLNRYLQHTYDISGGVPYGGDGFIETLATSQSPMHGSRWSEGTADAVRLCGSDIITQSRYSRISEVLILPADQLYKLDFTQAINYHRRNNAHITIICRPCCQKQAERLGVVKLHCERGPDEDTRCNITQFTEKPKDPALLQMMRLSPEAMDEFNASSLQERRGRVESAQAQAAKTLRAVQASAGSSAKAIVAGVGVAAHPGAGPSGSGTAGGGALEREEEMTHVASCGMYVFDRKVLHALLNVPPAGEEALTHDATSIMVEGGDGVTAVLRALQARPELRERLAKAHDFGRDLIPLATEMGLKVMAYRLDGPWFDVGDSIGDYYNVSMQMLAPGSEASQLLDADMADRLYQARVALPPLRTYGTIRVVESVVSSGCEIRGSTIRHSIIGPRSIIGENCLIERSIVMGADFYELDKPALASTAPNLPPMGIGANTVIRKAIVDKNARVGSNVQLVNKEGIVEATDTFAGGFVIRDGIIVVPKSAVVHSGTVV